MLVLLLCELVPISWQKSGLIIKTNGKKESALCVAVELINPFYFYKVSSVIVVFKAWILTIKAQWFNVYTFVILKQYVFLNEKSPWGHNIITTITHKLINQWMNVIKDDSKMQKGDYFTEINKCTNHFRISSPSALRQNAQRWLFPTFLWWWMGWWWGKLPGECQAWRADSLMLGGQELARYLLLSPGLDQAYLRAQRRHTVCVLRSCNS